MRCSITALTTGAVPSGRKVRERSPRSLKVYICLFTTSELSPTPRSKTSVYSKVGVSTGAYPAAAKRSIARRVTACHSHDSGGRRSRVPLGASKERSDGVMKASYGRGL
jgi:hypothetical protein